MCNATHFHSVKKKILNGFICAGPVARIAMIKCIWSSKFKAFKVISAPPDPTCITLWSRGLEKFHCFCTSRLISVKCFGHLEIRYNKQQDINISHPILKPDYAALIYIFQNFLFWKFRKTTRKRTKLLWSLMLLFPLQDCVATTTTLTFPWAFLFPVYVVSIKGSNRFQLKTKKALEGTPSRMTTVSSIFALKLLEMMTKTWKC